MRIVFDNRESGTTTGRYMDKLVEYLQKVDTINTYLLLTKHHRLDRVRITNPNFRLIECNIKEFTFDEQIALNKQISSLKPDLVHFPIVQQPILYRGKTVTTMQDLTTLRFTNPTKNLIKFKIMQFVYFWVNYIVVRKSTKLIAISKYTRDDCIRALGARKDKFTVIYHSADKLPKSSEVVPDLEKKQFIMFVGRHQPHKNLQRLIDAHQKILKSYPDLHLAIIGKPDASTDYLKLQNEEAGVKNVVFTGFISDAQLRWAYEHTGCYVFPSLSEGFGLPGLEAMAHGAPVASSGTTSLPEVNGDAALYFDPLDTDDIANKIQQVLSDKKLANQLRIKGFEQVKKFSWKRTAEQTLKVYEEALRT
jgi:glycosyltransferase involved in cell wall biosynthesis